MPDVPLAADIGDTFTDVVLKQANGNISDTLMITGDLRVGSLRAIRNVTSLAGVQAGMIDDVVVHATTVVTNAIIERKVPEAGLLVTDGFRDALVIRDER